MIEEEGAARADLKNGSARNNKQDSGLAVGMVRKFTIYKIEERNHRK